MSARSKGKERDDKEQCGDVFHTTEHRMRPHFARIKFGRKTALMILSISRNLDDKRSSNIVVSVTLELDSKHSQYPVAADR